MASTINAETMADAREAFMRGYVEAILWVDTLVNGEGRDVTYWWQSPGRWWQDTPVSLDDAGDFWDRFAYVILSLDYAGRGEEWHRAELAGRDFALTRNRHGAGFWDRGLGEIGDMLTAESEAYGSHSVYIEVDEHDDILATYNEN